MTHLLFTRLIARGHQSINLHPIFLEATTWLEDHYDPMVDNIISTTTDTLSDDVNLFFHIPFHTRDILRQKIRDIYKHTGENDNGINFKCMLNDYSGKSMKINRLTVAYSRPKNLRDLLCPSKLAETDDVHVAKYINN